MQKLLNYQKIVNFLKIAKNRGSGFLEGQNVSKIKTKVIFFLNCNFLKGLIFILKNLTQCNHPNIPKPFSICKIVEEIIVILVGINDAFILEAEVS